MPAPHATAPCYFCTHPVHPGAVGTFELVTGWGEFRADGGMNAVRLAEHHRKFAHRTCVDRAKAGHRRGQASLEEVAETEEREAMEDVSFPVFDGSQTGMTAVACPHCDYCGLADKLPRHLQAQHADVD